MLRLLLDEHVAPAVVAGLRRRNKTLAVRALREWHEGAYWGQDDAACLRAAHREGLTLVTYDLRTIPRLLKRWAEEKCSHGGMIFVDEKTIIPADVGGLVRALASLQRESGAGNWQDRVVYLRR
jgi:hypothetical protein